MEIWIQEKNLQLDFVTSKVKTLGTENFLQCKHRFPPRVSILHDLSFLILIVEPRCSQSVCMTIFTSCVL